MRKLLCALLVLALMIGTLASAENENTETIDMTGYLVILHTGGLAGEPGQGLSLARLTHVKKQMENAGASVILLDAGGSLFGGANSLPDGGAAMFDLMAQAGYDAVAIGEKDLVLGGQAVRLLAGREDAPAVLMPGEEDAMLEKGGLRIGLFSLENSDAQAHVKALDGAGCDLILALGGDGALSKARQADGIDAAILTGGETLPEGSWSENGMLIARVEEGLGGIGCVLIDGQGRAAVMVLDEGYFDEGSIDQEFMEQLAQFASAREEAAGMSLGSLETELSSPEQVCQWAGALLSERYGADAALLFDADVTGTLPAGEISLQTIRGAFAEKLGLTRVAMSGALLKQRLEAEGMLVYGASASTGGDGQAVWTVGEEPLDEKKEYILLTTLDEAEGEPLGDLEFALTAALLNHAAENETEK